MAPHGPSTICERSFRKEMLVAAVGIELLTKLNKSHIVAVLPTVYQMNWSQMELNWFGTH
jgi:hypothetical protein